MLENVVILYDLCAGIPVVRKIEMISIEQIKELQLRVETLGRCIAVETKREEVAQMQEKTLAADFWDDPKAAEKFLKELSGVKFWVTGYDKVAADVEDLNVLLELKFQRRAIKFIFNKIFVVNMFLRP